MPRTSNGRIALAITLSLLIHAAMLSKVSFQQAKVQPLPLVVRIEPLPVLAAKPLRKHKPQAEIPPTDIPHPDIASEEAEANKLPGNSDNYEASPVNQSVANSQQEEFLGGFDPQPIKDASEYLERIEETASVEQHLFPKHAQLIFAVYKGKDFEVGQVRHSLEIGEDKNYVLQVKVNTTGIASFFKTYELNQQSSGILTSLGLRPARFSETKNTSKGRETNEALFAWEEKLLSFSNGGSTPLPEHTQDIISFLYQLPQLLLNEGTISIYISNGRKLERYRLAIGEEEMIQTSLGRLRALKLHKLHAPGEEGLDIWLGLEYRLLPVKISTLDRDGQVAGEMVISEIRVAD